MNLDTIAIIVAILGVGLALWRSIATIRQDIDSRYKELRQDMAEFRAETRQELRSLNSRIDALYQALFSHKDPAA